MLQYGLNVGIARAFGASALGVFTFAFAVVAIASTLGQAGFRETLVHFVSAYSVRGEQANLRGVVICGLVVGLLGACAFASVLYAASNGIGHLSSKPEVIGVLRSLCWAVPTLAVASLAAAALQGVRRLGRAALVREAGRPLAGVVAVAVCACFGWAFSTFLVAFAACLTLLAVAGMVIVWRTVLVHASGNRTEFKTRTWFAFSAPIAAIDLFRTGSSWLDPILLGFLATSVQIGVYYSALRTAILLTIALAALNAILTPLTAALWARRDIGGLQRAFRTTTRWTWLATFPVALMLILLRTDVMRLFGRRFLAEGPAVLAVLVAGRLVNAMTGGVGQILVMTGRQRLEAINNLIAVVLTVAGMIVVVPRYGVIGAAAVNASVIALINIVKLVEVALTVGVQPYDMSYVKILGAAGTAAVVGVGATRLTAGWSWVGAAVVVVLGIAVSYVGAIVALGLDMDDWVLVRGFGRRLGIGGAYGPRG